MRIEPLYWSPSRMNFSAFKLLAWILVRNQTRTEPRPDIDRVVVKGARGRNGFEAFSVAIAHTLLGMIALFALIEPFARARALMFLLSSPFLLIAGLIATQLALFLICLLVFSLRRALRLPPSMRMNAQAIMAATVLVAAWLIARGGWSRWPGWIWIALLGLNAAASIVTFLMRERLRKLDLEIERGAPFAA